MISLLKHTDEKYIRYVKLLDKVRKVLRVGINEKNSFEFWVNIDELKPLIKYVKLKYNTQPRSDLIEFIKLNG